MRNAQRRFDRWLAQYHNPETVRLAEGLPLRRDMVTLLQYVQENKVVGTQGTGNMPLKAVREVTARFVNPPELDPSIGDHVYRLRTEADVWPLYFLHILAEVSGLVLIAPARRWRVTADGRQFLDMDALLQVSFLLSVWWHGINWLVVYPYEGMGERLPKGFEQAALRRVRALPVEERIPFEEFADGLIDETGLTWTAQIDSARMFLRGSIKRMVVDTLTSFGAAECEYQEEPAGKGTISRLTAFRITPLGKALLEGLGAVTGLA